MFLIMIFILILNAVAIALTYYCLENIQKKEKIIFMAVGIAVIYALTSFVYWISANDIEIKEVAEQSKNLITFLFVPVNTIFVLPILAKSYVKYKTGRIEEGHLRNRTILLAILLIVLLVIEFFYFKDIQTQVVKAIEDRKQDENILPPIFGNLLEESNTIRTNDITNEFSDEISNIVDSNIINENIISNIIETNVTDTDMNIIETNTID